MQRDSFGHTPASRFVWMIVAGMLWAVSFDVFYNQHAHHGRFMLMVGLTVFATLNVLTPAWPKDRS